MEPSKDSTLHKIIFHPSACSLVGFWANKLDWCWFVVRGKHYWLADKPWLKPINEQAACLETKYLRCKGYELSLWLRLAGSRPNRFHTVC